MTALPVSSLPLSSAAGRGGRRALQTGAGQVNRPAFLYVAWTISDGRLLCQPKVVIEANLNIRLAHILPKNSREGRILD